MYDVLSARVPRTSGALTTVSESIGWLGNPNTREVAAWSSYGGDRRSAAWFLSGAEAEQWRAFSAPMMATIRQADSLMIWADLKLGWQPSVANLAAGGTVHWETAGPLSWSDVPQRMLYFMDEKYTTVDSLDLSTGSARRAFPTPGDYRYCSAGCWDPPDFGIIHVH
jgi:plastocyanin